MKVDKILSKDIRNDVEGQDNCEADCGMEVYTAKGQRTGKTCPETVYSAYFSKWL